MSQDGAPTPLTPGPNSSRKALRTRVAAHRLPRRPFWLILLGCVLVLGLAGAAAILLLLADHFLAIPGR